jgi:hypothetical protein
MLFQHLFVQTEVTLTNNLIEPNSYLLLFGL